MRVFVETVVDEDALLVEPSLHVTPAKQQPKFSHETGVVSSGAESNTNHQARDQQQPHPPPIYSPSPHYTANMADKMDIDAVNGEKEQETVGPAPDLPPERSTSPALPEHHR